MSDKNAEERIDAAVRAVRSQTELLHQQFGKEEFQLKPDGSRVTRADIAISQGIQGQLAAQFPEDQFFSEELENVTGPVPVTARFSWLLDPIDGTNNYILGIPHCAIALALLKNGQPLYGVVYDFSRQKLIHGGPGFGLREGDKPLVTPERPGHEVLIGLHRPNDPALLSMAGAILSRYKIRGLGSATLHLAYVAAGLLDGAVDFNVKIWDIAAAVPLCLAAGVEIRFLNGEPFPMQVFDLNMSRIVYVAAKPPLCQELTALMGSIAD